MSRIKSLRTLVGVRRRKGNALEQCLADALRRLAHCRAEADAAREARQHSAQREHAARERRNALIDSPFAPPALQALDHVVQTLAVHTASADKALRDCEAALHACERTVTEVRAELRRNAQRIDRFTERIDELLRERAQAIDDEAEEDAEETAVARMLMRRRRVEPTGGTAADA